MSKMDRKYVKIKNKYTKCPPDDVGYEQDCPLKRSLKRIFSGNPNDYIIHSVEFTERHPLVDPKKTYDIYGGIRIEIELYGYYFNLDGKLKEHGK